MSTTNRTRHTMKRQALLSGVLLLQSLLLASARTPTALTESCLAVVKDIFSEDRKELMCQTPSGMLYLIPSVDDAWIEERMISGELVSGETELDLPNGITIDREDQTLNMDHAPILVNGPNRKLQSLPKAQGTRTVLAVRIEADNGELSKTEEELRSSVFGGPNDFVNLKSQYAACSHGKLDMTQRPYLKGVTTDIQDGVVNIRVNLPVEVGHRTMVNAVSQEIQSQFNISMPSIADHVMYCLPKGTFGGVGYAVVNGKLSVFNDKLCTSVSAQMHEVGHNLNMGHSGLGGEQYGDQSCMMGFSYRSSEAPKMCFNAAKSFQLGWYDDKSQSFIPGTGGFGDVRTFTLSNVVDYPTTNQDVLLEIKEPAREQNYYVGFNVAKGFNEGVRHGKNQVLVFKNPIRQGTDSLRVADLKSGDSFIISDWNNVSGDTLTIEVLAINTSTDEAQVRVSLNRLNAPPTPAPTKIPTTAPTRLPTRRPTPSPTFPQFTGVGGVGGVAGRNPQADDVDVTTAQSCSDTHEACVSSSDCCSGLTCRRVSQGGAFANVCRPIAKNSKDKFPRTTTHWWQRRLRGDSSAHAARQPEDELLDQ